MPMSRDGKPPIGGPPHPCPMGRPCDSPGVVQQTAHPHAGRHFVVTPPKIPQGHISPPMEHSRALRTLFGGQASLRHLFFLVDVPFLAVELYVLGESSQGACLRERGRDAVLVVPGVRTGSRGFRIWQRVLDHAPCGQGGRPGTTRARHCQPWLLPPTCPATRNHGRRSSIGHRALPSTLRRSLSSRSHTCVTLNCVRIFQCLGRLQASRRHFFLRPSPLAPCLHARCCRGDHIVQAHAPRCSPSCSSAPPVDINRQLRSIYILHTAPTSLRSFPLALSVRAWCCATDEFVLPGAPHRSRSDLSSPSGGIRRWRGGIWHLQRP